MDAWLAGGPLHGLSFPVDGESIKVNESESILNVGISENGSDLIRQERYVRRAGIIGGLVFDYVPPSQGD